MGSDLEGCSNLPVLVFINQVRPILIGASPKGERGNKMKRERHTCSKECLCGLVRMDRSKSESYVDKVSMAKCAAYLPFRTSRVFCALTGSYVSFDRVQ